MKVRDFFAPKGWIILSGFVFGTLGALAVTWGNPPNMGICVACFLRDVAGALKLHQNEVAQYIRPEVIGFILGACVASAVFREWRPRGGSSPLVRFLLGAFVMIGVLVFLGCPVRMMLRIAGGDLNGILALAGFATGILTGVHFLRKGFTLGHAATMPAVAGALMPLVGTGLLFFLIVRPAFIAFSERGPGSQHVPLFLGLVLGFIIGMLVQRTRFCSIGAWRDIFLVKDFTLFSGVAAFVTAALATNYLAGNFSLQGVGYHWGFTQQAIALPMTDWTQYLWTFLSMGLVGLAGTQLDGCPLRSLILSGEGDTDAGVTVMGYIAGAACAHNFLLASSAKGLGAWGPLAVSLGLAFCVTIGFLMREEA